MDGWLKPFDPGFTFGGNVGVQPDTPNRIFILQRGSTRLPNPVPAGYEGFAGSIGVNGGISTGDIRRRHEARAELPRGVPRGPRALCEDAEGRLRRIG